MGLHIFIVGCVCVVRIIVVGRNVVSTTHRIVHFGSLNNTFATSDPENVVGVAYYSATKYILNHPSYILVYSVGGMLSALVKASVQCKSHSMQ